MVAQFLVGGIFYLLLLLLTLGEEFKHCPAPLQSLCCWIHETKPARTLLTLAAIAINFGVASSDFVSLMLSYKSGGAPFGKRPILLTSCPPSLQLWCDSPETRVNSSASQLAPPTSVWPSINICTHPEVSANTSTIH